MSLRYALLAVLTVEPMTGYDLAKLFRQSVAHVWNAPDSQIYPELKKMEKEQLISGKDVRWGTKGTKRQYEISEAGLQDFRKWMNEPVVYFLERDSAHLKAAYLEWADTQEAFVFFEEHRSHFSELLREWSKRLEEIENLTNPLLVKRLSIYPLENHQKIIAFKLFTYRGLIARAHQEMRWAEEGIQLLNTLNK
jgi:PadR family transcriptional regulator, regulatory protein AphA